MADSRTRTLNGGGDRKIARFSRERRRMNPAYYVDFSLLILVMLLVAFGLVMLYSTTSYVADLNYGDGMYYLKRQLVFAVLGFILMALLSWFPYPYWKELSLWIYIACLILSVAVLAVGQSGNGSTRWMRIGSISFQPSELAKVAVIMFMAALISKAPREMKNVKGIVKALLFVAVLFVLVAKENLSTAFIILGIAVIMLFVASPHYRHWIALACVAAALIPVAIVTLGGYRAERIDAWLHPETAKKAYQTRQALYAIGSGGLFGKGLGRSMQKNGFVPEAKNDMIFSIICEELGLIGAICLIILFMVLIWRLLLIAIHCRDMFGSYLVIGIMAHIALQVMLNIAVVTNLIPNTGVTLPFISYGGSALIITMGEMGIALCVSRNTDAGLDA